jgi:exonuclease III
MDALVGLLTWLLLNSCGSFCFLLFIMNTTHQTRKWKVLCWNVRGLNAKEKWEAVRDKISESGCDVICLQETKRQFLDAQFIKNFCPSSFDAFEFLPSVGASGGITTIWKSSLFSGSLVFSNEYAISIEFFSKHDQSAWLLTNVYGPCTSEGKINFLNWLKDIQIAQEVDWLIVGDFNLIRGPYNRNKPGGNIQEMLLFNEVISAQGWVELPLRGRKYTWSNKQSSPLLERLDWFFTSASWTTSFPDSSVTSLSMEPSDHVPCVVSINTSIPKSSIFRFENYWLEHEHFLAVVAHGWSVPTFQTDSAKILSAKFKNLRRVLKSWQSQISNLKVNIANVKSVLILLGF